MSITVRRGRDSSSTREARMLDDRDFDGWLECYAPTSSTGCRRGTTTTS